MPPNGGSAFSMSLARQGVNIRLSEAPEARSRHERKRMPSRLRSGRHRMRRGRLGQGPVGHSARGVDARWLSWPTEAVTDAALASAPAPPDEPRAAMRPSSPARSSPRAARGIMCGAPAGVAGRGAGSPDRAGRLPRQPVRTPLSARPRRDAGQRRQKGRLNHTIGRALGCVESGPPGSGATTAPLPREAR